MQQHGSTSDRGKKRANFAVLRTTNMPSILTESLFIESNDGNRLKDEAFLKAVGEAHARGVAKFLELPEKPKQTKRFSFYTGGYSGAALLEIHEYLKANKWDFTMEKNSAGDIMFTVGLFGEGSEAAIRFENWLTREDMHT
ncbi:N-acetylmuramoyl-L-alanine amidase [Bacillus sp. FJAT-49825]|uniref:N-acetylmuramoyl-L-alanine amidase n=1 Tax=Neobacillus rhizophilus TaxID=2833579 RepID=A0A942YVU6_9BACI|nr:N-acetylmuramoyl-L-alanine amidase [Neobacillus rhizophilus]